MINPTMPPPAPLPVHSQPAASPQQSPAFAPAMVQAQTVKPVATQTAKAAAPVARADSARTTQSSTFVGHAADSEAAAVRAQTPRRGLRLDLSV